MNDVIDLEVDRCNRPHRPLPSGRLSAGAALAVSALLGVTGLTLAFVAGIIPGLIAFAVVIGLALYNWFLKRVGLAGNVLVSLIAIAPCALALPGPLSEEELIELSTHIVTGEITDVAGATQADLMRLAVGQTELAA
mgnify:CR=1 FL=1